MEENELTSQYFKLVKICGSLVGIWPFQYNWWKTIIRPVMYTCAAFTFFTQGSRIVLFYSFDVLTEQIPYLCVAIITFIKYFNYDLQQIRFTELLSDLSVDWKSLKTAEETVIMQMYAKRALMISFVYKCKEERNLSLSIYFMTVAYGTIPLMPRILDYVNPLNESREWLFVFPGYYFIDEHKYYYFILCYTIFCMIVVAIIMLFTDLTHVYLVQHACSLLCIAGYRFKNAVDSTELSIKNPDESQDIVYNNLCVTIKTHNRSFDLVGNVEATYGLNLFFQVGISMISFSITLVMVRIVSNRVLLELNSTYFSPVYKITTPVTLKESSLAMYPVYLFLVVQLLHLLYLTIQGQFLIDTYNDIYFAIYDAQWYRIHHSIQLFYALALRSTLTPPLFTAGGLIRLNLDSFAEIIKTSVSYYTVMKSS
ncbi:uncharacterized protein LOC143183215 [Calliopsis andreniformis]|uniref:uncharacterized protein LOC143183215 n=1 Tax=Calliopsis andreniformis TaxID=337506 RepID=UPI003FCD24FB